MAALPKAGPHPAGFYVYQLPIPRLTEADATFRPIVERAARLVGWEAKTPLSPPARGGRPETEGSGSESGSPPSTGG